MALRIGFLSVAHMHAWGYVHGFGKHPDCELVGVYDDDAERRAKFAASNNLQEFESPEALLQAVDAVSICSVNKEHAQWVELAAKHGKPAICEKPLITTTEEGERFDRAMAMPGFKLMTAFPCRYSPSYQKLRERVKAGEIGTVRAICATNRGSCPFGWFVETDKSGGGAMIDHVVHVTDLMRDLLGEEVVRVQAQIGNNMYGQAWDDTAMLTLEFASGIFATLDSSWSRYKNYKTWGDVTMNVVGDAGMIELDMFGQQLDYYRETSPTHALAGYGSDLDAGLVNDFVDYVLHDKTPRVSGFDGLQASRVAIAGYESVRTGQPVALA